MTDYTAEAFAPFTINGGSRVIDGDERLVRADDEPDDGNNDDDDEAPETPLDEPAPMPIRDPPDEPNRGPYTVHRRRM